MIRNRFEINSKDAKYGARYWPKMFEIGWWRVWRHQFCALHQSGGVMRRRNQPRRGFGGRSGQQVGRVDQALGDVAQAQALVHGGLAQQVVGLRFANAAPLHQQALGAFDELALAQL